MSNGNTNAALVCLCSPPHLPTSLSQASLEHQRQPAADFHSPAYSAGARWHCCRSAAAGSWPGQSLSLGRPTTIITRAQFRNATWPDKLLLFPAALVGAARSALIHLRPNHTEQIRHLASPPAFRLTRERAGSARSEFSGCDTSEGSTFQLRSAGLVRTSSLRGAVLQERLCFGWSERKQ